MRTRLTRLLRGYRRRMCRGRQALTFFVGLGLIVYFSTLPMYSYMLTQKAVGISMRRQDIPDYQVWGAQIDILGTQAQNNTSSSPSSTLPENKAVFLPNQTKMVILLSYQRSGSSMIGNLLFDVNQQIHYVYEPLDALYSSMYGSDQGWNIPADITTHNNGSYRQPSQAELDGVSWTLQKTLSCEAHTFPVQMLVHKYYWLWGKYTMKNLKTFTECMSKYKATGRHINLCRQKHISKVCPLKFSPNVTNTTYCYNHLWGNNKEVDTSEVYSRPGNNFLRYKQCLGRLDQRMSPCRSILEKTCSKSPTRAVKTVRATMRSLEPLLAIYPNLRVVHLFRDPRGVIKSRQKNRWTQGNFAGHDLTREARVYCNTVLEDVRQRKRLEQIYPGRFMQLVYDDFILYPEQNVKNVYRFLDMESQKNDSVIEGYPRVDIDRAYSWRSHFKNKDIVDILHTCRSFYTETSHQWPILK